MLKFLIEKEFRQLRRNSFVLRLILMMPIMMMVVMPFAANQEVLGIRASIVDNDHSTYSERMTQKLDASEYVSIEGHYATYGQALEAVEQGRADMIVEIEDEFEKNFIDVGATRVMISANSVNGTKGSIGSSYISSIINDYAADLRAEATASGSIQGTASSVASFSVAPSYKFNPHLDYKVFMVPALMVMLLTMLSGFLPALNIVGEKEAGTIEQINVTPVKKMSFVLAKLIPYWIIGFAVLALCMILAWAIYSLVPIGNLLTIFGFASIYVLVVSGMGLVVSNYSSTMQQSMFVMYFFVMILLLMSGLFTPVNSMPGWAQWIARFNPLHYFIDVMRLVYLKGSGFANLLPQFFALCGFAIGFGGWAVLNYRKSK